MGGPLIYALEEPDRKAIFIGFDLFKTDFPLRVAFPLILSNSCAGCIRPVLDQASLSSSRPASRSSCRPPTA